MSENGTVISVIAAKWASLSSCKLIRFTISDDTAVVIHSLTSLKLTVNEFKACIAVLSE